MKQRSTALSCAFGVTLLAMGVLAPAGCESRIERAAAPSNPTSLCISNMMAVWLLLRDWQGEGNSYPADLSFIANRTNRSLFLCPTTGHRPGDPSDVSKWTDFMYVSQSQTEPRIAMLLSPPEDHGGRFGIVVWESGYWDSVSPSQFRALVETPWCMEYSPSSPAVKILKQEMTVHVPERFSRTYPDAYAAPRRETPTSR